MSDINTTLINSVKKVERDVADIKQMLHSLQDQFNNQFGSKINEEEVNVIQQGIMEQSALERVAESVKRAQLTEYPNRLGKRLIDTDGEFKGKHDSQRYNILLQMLHRQDWEAKCKEIPEGQSLCQLVLLTEHELTMKRLLLKTLARATKRDLIDKDYHWKNGLDYQCGKISKQ
ncbi:hypothetical protein INT47_009671 [Mucor saturninus]|uniref:Uncharacterized protein n=1 Tax=Mucor saturninus TaxID=64648 RepID=A0A8H7QKP5_9FUNG|nr:hypothetical protein INT47_009671 [Mucor saturninus]